MLKAAGSDPHHTDVFGKTPIKEALSKGHNQIADILRDSLET